MLFGVLLFLLAAPATVLAQGQVNRDHVPGLERVDPLAREASDIDGNNVRATMFNTGLTGRTGVVPGEIPYEFPKNTRRHYIALTGIFVGAEVEGTTGEMLWVVDLPRFRSSRIDESISWTFEPIPGYADPQAGSIARSDEPSTWPSFWPDKLDDATDPGWSGSWNGFFGKDVFNADQELYYKMGDDQYNRYLISDNQYYPDATDLTRGGLGLVADTRILAWSQILIDDVVFIIHNVKNDGTENLRKVGVTLWLADLVGGDGDSSDDQPFYDLLTDIAFMTDRDGVGNAAFQSAPVGAASAIFLETPGNAVDRIDNDGDGSTGDDVTMLVGEPGSPIVMPELLVGECPVNGAEGFPPSTCFDGLDNNGNGLIDENQSHIPIPAAPGQLPQAGVGYADFIDNDGDGEPGSPVVTQAMADAARADVWNRWPPNPDLDGGDRVHLLGVQDDDVGFGFKDGIDNDGSCATPGLILSEEGSPTVTQEMVAAASGDPYGRFAVPGTDIVLYLLGPEDLGKCYADGLDNDGDGATDEGIDENIDEMIDESRADGIDNDNDWRPALDDVGLDGAGFTSDTGENDGQPSSGAGTDFPGEPNIDVTDISESDQIGITNVDYVPAGGIDYSRISDRELFNRFMVPGQFFDPTILEGGGDFDLFVSSGLFPLQAGQTERISFAVILGEDDRNAGSFEQRFRDIIGKRDNANDAYLADYRFAQAPIVPTLRAVPGNGKVTLYWDSEAEDSFDSFLADIGLPARDFEGYRVYRSTDAAFLDAKVITDGFGNAQFLRPIAQFDLVDGVGGFHPVAVNGTQFFLGNDQQDPGEGSNGLAHVFVDSTVTNGVTYFYAVTSYDFGAVPANIPPSESPIRIRFNADGSIETGPNVAEVTPTASAAGVVEATLENDGGLIPRVQGFTTSRIGFQVVDPREIQDGHRYRVVFEDTLIAATSSTASDTLTTRNFSLLDLDDGETLIDRSDTFREGREAPVVEGFQLFFQADPFIVLDRANTSWDNPDVYPVVLEPFSQPPFVRGFRNPADYQVVMGPPGSGQSVELEVGPTTTVPARATNFRVVNVSTGQDVDYAFADRDDSDGGILATGPATYTATPMPVERSDFIILIEDLPGGERGVTWRISLDFTFTDKTSPGPNDTATIVTKKPFLAGDVFEFTARGPQVDAAQARTLLDEIRVVPNPYRGASLFEGTNPFASGRGEREIRFINLPPQCSIRIFTVSGHLVRRLEHFTGSNDALTAADLLNGEEAWDLQSEDNLTVAYGVYLYHVDAPGIGEKTGTFAIIK